MDDQEDGALEALENKLYDPKGKIDNIALHHVRDRKEKELPTKWGDDTPIIRESGDKGGFSFGAKFLIGALILLFSVLAFTAWRVLSSRNVVSDKNIDIALDVAPYVEGGEDTPLTVSLTNRNQLPLEKATLTLIYKQGNGAQDETEKVQEKTDIGTINSGDFKRNDFKIRVYGSEAESRDVTVRLDYQVQGSSATFNKSVVTQVVLKSAPISVRIDGPQLLSVGQLGTYVLSVINNTATTTSPSILLVTFPTNFQIESQSPRPNSRNNLWQIGALAPGATSTVTISGSFTGNQGETSTLKAVVGSTGGSLSQVGVVYSSSVQDVTLRTSPLTFKLSVDSEQGNGENLHYGDRAHVTIAYTNEGQVPLQNPELVLSISGDAPLAKDITADRGYYDSSRGTIIWNKSTMPELSSIAPGQGGTLFVTVPIVLKGVNSPKMTLMISGKATIKDPNDVVASITRTFVVQGSASISASTHYKTSPFQNTGPIPPQVNVDTSYTAHLIVSAQNALENTKVSFTLPVYVSWQNTVTDPTHTSYDSKTRTVTWNVGNVGAGKSVATDINLSVRPSQVHVNSVPPITSGIVLDADESVSHAHLHTTISALTTYIQGENWTVNPSLVVDHQ
jgi:hypothetical protein